MKMLLTAAKTEAVQQWRNFWNQKLGSWS